MHTSSWHPSTWDMKILCLAHNLSCNFCLLLYSNVWHDTFHLWWLFLPLLACQCLSAIPILFPSFSDMASMLILVPTKSMQNQACIFPCICCESFQIHQSIVVYHSLRINHDTLLDFVFWNLPRLFLQVRSQHLWYLPFLDCCEIARLLAMTFNWIFSISPHTLMVKPLSTKPDKFYWHLNCRIYECFGISWLDLC